jgi:hypothetical protein
MHGTRTSVKTKRTASKELNLIVVLLRSNQQNAKAMSSEHDLSP